MFASQLYSYNLTKGGRLSAIVAVVVVFPCFRCARHRRFGALVLQTHKIQRKHSFGDSFMCATAVLFFHRTPRCETPSIDYGIAAYGIPQCMTDFSDPCATESICGLHLSND